MTLVGCLDTRFYFAHAEERAHTWTRRLVDQSRMEGSRIISSTLTITELLSTMTPHVGLETVQLRLASMKAANIMFVPPSEEIASMAGELLIKNQKLSIADAIIASTALVEADGRLYTDDPHFKQIPGIQRVWGKL